MLILYAMAIAGCISITFASISKSAASADMLNAFFEMATVVCPGSKASIAIDVDTTKSIADICYLCCYNNLSNFNRVFKRKKGCSPTEFREYYRKKKIIL